jgi:hypothetical protein
MPVPDFSPGEVLTAAAMDSIGSWLVASGSNSNTTSLVIDNCFSANYAHYRIVFTATGGAAGTTDAFVQFRVGATPTATNYFYNTIFSSNTAGPSRAYLGSQVSGQIGNFGDERSTIVCDVYNPQVAASTNYVSLWQGWGSAANFVGTTQGYQTSSNQHTGFQITCSSAFTGTARVYGYRN